MSNGYGPNTESVHVSINIYLQSYSCEQIMVSYFVPTNHICMHLKHVQYIYKETYHK